VVLRQFWGDYRVKEQWKLPLKLVRTEKGLKTGFTSFTEVQVLDSQCPLVKLHAFTRFHQVSQ
jgi:hypothetical protein